MKKFILGFIFGAILFTGIGVLASNIFARDIKYTPTDDTWKKEDGSDILNVNDAIEELYKNRYLISTSSYYTADEYSHIRTSNISLNLPQGKYLCFYNAFNSSYGNGNFGKHDEIVNSPSRDEIVSGCNKYNNLEKSNYTTTPNTSFENNHNFIADTYKMIFTCDMNNNGTLNIRIPHDSGSHSSFETFLSCVPILSND